MSIMSWPSTEATTKSYIDDEIDKAVRRVDEQKLWNDILLASKTDPGLVELLDCVKMYYVLGKE